MQLFQLKNKIDIASLWKDGYQTVLSKSRWLLLLVAILILGYCGYLWYNYIAFSQWNDQKKQAYLNEQDKAAVFNKNKFDTAISKIEERKNNFQEDIGSAPDIFKLQ